jgi:SAM-dependent methyltransferase
MLSNRPRCRFSGIELTHVFADLGMSPFANSYLRPEQLNTAEKFYPLRAYVSEDNFLVQLEQFESADHIFSDYAYFSSYSDSWLVHAKNYVEMMISRFKIDKRHQVIEIASNDGYLLRYFRERAIPVLGIEPAANVAEAARKNGIPSVVRFFGLETARELVAGQIQADLLLGNNVLAHVPDLNDFVAGLKIALKPTGVITMEFPHLLQLIQKNQFDTIYHEHFSYFSFFTVERVFAKHGITLFDVEELPTHGGSLRIFGMHAEQKQSSLPRVAALKEKEISAGLTEMATYLNFGEQVKETKRKLLAFLIEARRAGKSIVGYGAPAKGNTLLNYCGIGRDFIDYTVDLSPHKQGLALPGTHIPIATPDRIAETKPDYLLILPWNLREEIMTQMEWIRKWGGQFVVPIPEVAVYS